MFPRSSIPACRYLLSATLSLPLLGLSSFAHAQGRSVGPTPQEKSSKSKSGSSSQKEQKSSTEGMKRHDPGGSGSGSSSRRGTDANDRSNTSSTSRSSTSSSASHSSGGGEFAGRALFTIGGHVSIADENLASLGRKVGGGGNATIGLGPRSIPLFFGIQGGIDSFGSAERSFTHQGQFGTYDLRRIAGWGHGFVRYSPLLGRLRPHVDVVGGFWHYNVSVQETWDLTTEIDDETSLGGATTGSYGFGAGLHYQTQSNLLFGVSLLHLRGGKMTVPDTENTLVVDDVLYYGETTVKSVHQWVILFEIGGISP